MRIAIYDLDRTLTARPTFTPFLLFAARRLAPWRLPLVVVWVFAMLGYRIGLYDRTTLKRFGMRLMVGTASENRLDAAARDFAAHHIVRTGWQGKVLDLMEDDRRKGARIVIATAAFHFYARHFGALLEIDDLVATRWKAGSIAGGNCYGKIKRERVLDWLADQGFGSEAIARVVSDSFADRPLLELASEPVFVAHSRRKAERALALGWTVIPG